MNDAHGQEIERNIADALAAIGNAAPPEGMEGRLQLALRQREIASTRPGMFLHWRWVIPAAGLAAVAWIAIGLRHAHTSPASTPSAGMQASWPMPVHAPEARVIATQPVPQFRQSRAHLQPVSISPRSESAVSSTGNGEHDQPPPPLPVTAEEKMLLQFVHRGEPLQMAALDDAHSRGIDFAAQKQQFDDFFYLNAQEISNDAN